MWQKDKANRFKDFIYISIVIYDMAKDNGKLF